MKPHRVTILQKGLLVLALPLLYQVLFIALLMQRQSNRNEAQARAVHTKEILAQTDLVHRMLLTAQTNLRACLLAGGAVFAQELVSGQHEIAAEFRKLRKMVQDDPLLRMRLESLTAHAQPHFEFERSMVALVENGETAKARDAVRDRQSQGLMETLRAEMKTFRETGEKLDAGNLEALQQSNTVQNWIFFGGVFVSFGIAGLAAVVFSREISSRIETVTENTRRIANGETLPPLVAGTDEIRELDVQFHLLADHLRTFRLRERVYQEALERRAAELTSANRDLAQKNQEIEMFVYSVSHDLRSPLVNLQGFSKELELTHRELEKILAGEDSSMNRERIRKLVCGDVTESVRYIQTAVTRLSGIIDALLRLSRAGRVEYHPNSVDPNPIVRRIVESMRGTITRCGADVVVHELPHVWGDPVAIEQIFANLISNAVNYLDPKRPGKIEIGTVVREVKSLEKALTFYVKDNGLGIAEAYLPKVFAIFQRLHGGVAAGEGVGLALVLRVVERHGGQVWVESQAGIGSTFFVALPAAPQFSPLPAVVPRKERLNLPPPPRHDHATGNHSPGGR